MCLGRFLTNLTTLYLSGNLLTGPIPPPFGDSLKLQGLYLGNNPLTGTIPERLGLLSYHTAQSIFNSFMVSEH